MEIYGISLIVLWISTLLIFLVATLILKSKKENWGKFWMIWVFTAIITGIILIFLIISQEQFIMLLKSIKLFISPIQN